MWSPPIELTQAEQKIAARTRKTRTFFVFLRERRHELLDADFQHTLAQSYSPDPGGKEPVEAGLLALATLLQAYCNVGDRDAVALTVMDKRWQMVLDCVGVEQPPFSQGTLCNFRMRLIQHHLAKTLLERTVALAEKTGGFGARQLRAALDSTPLFGAGRVEDRLNLLGHARRKAVGVVARELDTSAEAIVAEAELMRMGHRSLKAALDLDWGEPTAREKALRLGLEEVERWQSGLEQQQRLSVQEPPRKEMMATIAQRVAQDTEPDPEADASSSTWRLIGASPSRSRTCATAARAARKLSLASRSTLPWSWTAKAPGRWLSARPTSRSVRLWSCWPRNWRTARACCSWISTWATWPARGLCSGPHRACTLLPGLGQAEGPSSPSTSSPSTSRAGMLPVQMASPCQWSQGETPSFRPVPVMPVPSARSAPPPGSGTAGA
jgi:hypothetical protein